MVAMQPWEIMGNPSELLRLYAWIVKKRDDHAGRARHVADRPRDLREGGRRSLDTCGF